MIESKREVSTMSAAAARRLAIRTVVLALALAAPVMPARAQGTDHLGTDFLVTFLENVVFPGFPGSTAYRADLYLSADGTTSVTVEYPAIAPTFTTTVAVGPGAPAIVTLPDAVLTWTHGSVQDNAVRVSGTAPFSVRLLSAAEAPTAAPFTGSGIFRSTDAATALPADAMGTEFIVTSQSTGYTGAGFAVVARCDDTMVTITPAAALVGGAAGAPFTVALDRGEAYYDGVGAILSAVLDDPTGTVVESSRPIAVTHGHNCGFVDPDFGGWATGADPFASFPCGHLFEVAQPVRAWGTEIPAANLPNRPGGSVYRIVASQDATTITLDGAVLGILDRAEFVETGPLPGNHVFAADAPIFVSQFMTSDVAPGAVNGDPAMVTLIPAEQYQSHQRFSRLANSVFGFHRLTVIAQNTDVGTLTLDGAPIPASSYSAIAGTGYSVAIVPIAAGEHVTDSVGGHAVTVAGYKPHNSYVFAAGAKFPSIEPIVPGCECGDGVLDPGEDCDDGNNVPGDGCSPVCEFEEDSLCGNGVLDPGEQCDDGNVWSGDGCSSDCRLEKLKCGNGVLDPGEQCDDGNVWSGDGCSADCKIEGESYCGNGVVEPGEQCDDGNAVDGDGCSSNCTKELCGNGVLDPGEQCDDGNLVNGDGCDDHCVKESSQHGVSH